MLEGSTISCKLSLSDLTPIFVKQLKIYSLLSKKRISVLGTKFSLGIRVGMHPYVVA